MSLVIFFSFKVVKLVSGGSVIKRAYTNLIYILDVNYCIILRNKWKNVQDHQNFLPHFAMQSQAKSRFHVMRVDFKIRQTREREGVILCDLHLSILPWPSNHWPVCSLGCAVCIASYTVCSLVIQFAL